MLALQMLYLWSFIIFIALVDRYIVLSFAYKGTSYSNGTSSETSILAIITSDLELTKYSESVASFLSYTILLCIAVHPEVD